MTRILITLAATAALSSGAFAQTLTSCSDFMAADDDGKAAISAEFNKELMANPSLQEKLTETSGDAMETAQRTEIIMAACEKKPEGSVFQAIEPTSN